MLHLGHVFGKNAFVKFSIEFISPMKVNSISQIKNTRYHCAYLKSTANETIDGT